MQNDELKQLIQQSFNDAEIKVDGDGHHFQAVIVSAQFAGQSRVQRQRAVYACVGDEITSGRVHALSLKTFTPEEWHQQHG